MVSPCLRKPRQKMLQKDLDVFEGDVGHSAALPDAISVE